MKYLSLLTFFIATIGSGQEINLFNSLTPVPQNENLILPCTHTFQLLVKEGQLLSDSSLLPSTADFTAYFPSGQYTGVLSVNHEINPGYISLHDLSFDTTSRLWGFGNSKYVDFSSLGGGYLFCSGGISYKGNLFAAEEAFINSDVNSDGYDDGGWICEIDPFTGALIDADSNGTGDKIWAMGKMIHENICFAEDSVTSYFGVDDVNAGFIFKFVADQPGNYHSGLLYVLRMNSSSDSTGTWLNVPNSSITEKNEALTFSSIAGAINFGLVEDVEFGHDGKVYFAASSNGRIYRFNDTGSNVNQFETYVSDQTYALQTDTGTVNYNWGSGMDNLCFDAEDNLWVMRDGGNGDILVVEKTHTMAAPEIRLFGQVPLGAEPTGINFSSDGKFMFMSVQHPSATNTATNYDAAGNPVIFDKSATIVIARREFLGNSIDASINNIPTVVCLENPPVAITANAYTGNFDGPGVLNDTLFPLSAGTGNHQITYAYIDSFGCPLFAYHDFLIPEVTADAGSNDTACTYGFISLTGSPAGGNWSGSYIDASGTINADSLNPGEHNFIYSVTDTNNCTATDTMSILFQLCTSVPENYPETLNIHPNPGDGTITVNKKIKASQVRVKDMNGREIKFTTKDSGNGMKIILQKNLKKGIYLIQIEGKIFRYVYE